MEFAMEVQKRQLGELLEGFIPTLLSRYEGMKEEPVYREGDEATIRRLRERGIPREGRPVRQVFEEMEKNERENKRYSGLSERILEVYGSAVSEVLPDMREAAFEELQQDMP